MREVYLRPEEQNLLLKVSINQRLNIMDIPAIESLVKIGLIRRKGRVWATTSEGNRWLLVHRVKR